jgi:hypothetical protein
MEVWKDSLSLKDVGEILKETFLQADVLTSASMNKKIEWNKILVS